MIRLRLSFIRHQRNLIRHHHHGLKCNTNQKVVFVSFHAFRAHNDCCRENIFDVKSGFDQSFFWLFSSSYNDSKCERVCFLIYVNRYEEMHLYYWVSEMQTSFPYHRFKIIAC